MTSAALNTTRFDGALRLPDWGLIRATGADGASFLHGQLTQDVLHLDPAQARLAGYCSAKGRLLASFVMWRGGTDEILLACSADLLPAALKRLSMFVLRAKCRLADAGSEITLYGLAGPSATRWLGDGAPMAPWQRRPVAGGDAIRLPDGEGVARYLFAAPAAGPAPALPPLDADAWRWLEVASGVVRITAATAEQFVPQMVNLELVGGVNFQKGCYPGQEVVARSQYRGTVKRRLQRVSSSAPLVPGQEVFDAGDPGQPAGMVALAASLDGRHHAALVEIKLAALDGELRAGEARLELGALPYEIPAEAA
jgi:hypothetical protein